MNGYTKIIVAIVLFSLGPLFVKIINLDAISILWSVNLIAVFVLTLGIIMQRRTKSLIKADKAMATLVALGFFFTINNSLFNLAVKTTTIANAVFTHYLAPIFVTVFGVMLIKEKDTTK